MKARQFQQHVMKLYNNQDMRFCAYGLSFFGMQATIEYPGIEGELKDTHFGHKQFVRVIDKINKGQMTSSEFFDDLEFPLNQERLNWIKEQALNKQPLTNGLLKCYETLLSQQDDEKQQKADRLKKKIDDAIASTIQLLEKKKAKLETKESALRAECDKLEDKSTEFYQTRLHKAEVIKQIVDNVYICQCYFQGIKGDLLKMNASDYPSLSEFRDVTIANMQGNIATLKEILSTNSEICQHDKSIGKIINAIIHCLTFGFLGYRTETQALVESAVKDIEQNITCRR